MELHSKTLEKAKSNISDAQQKQKQQYDKKYGGSNDINTGSIILLSKARNKAKKGGKQDPFWPGPYIVDQVTEKGFCKLRNRESGKMLQKSYSVSLLTLYKDNPVRKTGKGLNSMWWMHNYYACSYLHAVYLISGAYPAGVRHSSAPPLV